VGHCCFGIGAEREEMVIWVGKVEFVKVMSFGNCLGSVGANLSI
jgi:hypothetical protein